MKQNQDANQYRAARKFFKLLLSAQTDNDTQTLQMRNMLQVAISALKACELREDNPPLTWQHLKEMHGCPVFYDNGDHTGGEWGFVDAHNDTIRILDHDGSTWARSWPESRMYGAQVYRYPTTGGHAHEDHS